MTELFLMAVGVALALFGPQIVRADTAAPWPAGMQALVCRGCVALGLLLVGLALVSLAFWKREEWRRW